MTDYLTEKRLLYTNVFGQTIYDPKKGSNKFVYTDKKVSEESDVHEVNNRINDIITRETNLGKTIYKTERARLAVNDPKDYLLKKSEDLLGIKNELIKKYKELYPQNLNRYHDPELAYKRTISEINDIKSQLLSDHNYKFPTQIKYDRVKDDKLIIKNIESK